MQKNFIPLKTFIFLKTPKNIGIQFLTPSPQTDQAYVYMKVSEYPLPALPMRPSLARFLSENTQHFVDFVIFGHVDSLAWMAAF